MNEKMKCRSSRAAAKNFMYNISDELLTEILIRLPNSRHAARFGSVCKRWSSLVSEPFFIRSFLDHHLESHSDDGPLALLIQKHHYEYLKPPIIDSNCYQILFDDDTSFRTTTNYVNNFMPYDDVVIRGYFDDLLLVSRANADYKGRFCFCICNPMTKKWCELPEPLRPITKLVKCALVCRCREGHYLYDVALFFYKTHNYTYCKNTKPEPVWGTFLSSETWQWTPPVLFPPPRGMPMWGEITGRPWISNQTVPRSNGLIHWIEGHPSVHGEFVVAVNIMSGILKPLECYGEIEHALIPWPVDEKFSVRDARLGTCKGRLRTALISKTLDNKSNYLGSVLRVWELLERSDSWALVHNEPLEIQVEKLVMPLAIHPTNPNVVFIVTDGIHVLRYDMSCRTAQKIGHLPERLVPSLDLTTYPLCRPLWPTPVPSSLLQ